MSVTIRRATPDDAAGFARVMGDPGVYPGLMQLPFATEHAWRERLTESTAASKPDLVLAAERDGSVVGTAGLHPQALPGQLRRRHVAILGISVLPELQGQGIGTALMQTMCDFADRWVGLLRLELTVYTDNARAIALYRRFGFEVEGEHRGYALRDGELVDAFSMARLHPKPPAIAPRRASPPSSP